MKPPLSTGHRATYLDNQFRQMFRNLAYPDRLRNLDVNAWVQHCKAAGATTVFLDIKSGFANWDTKLFPRDPLLGHRDLGAEFARAARRHKLKFCFYIQMQNVDSIGDTHDDWQCRKADGSLEAAGWGWCTTVFCFNSGYRDLLCELLREISRKYRPHGFFLDIFVGLHTGCYCRACQAKFQAEFGRPIPVTPDWSSPDWYAYLQWRYREQAEAGRLVHEAIHGVDPRISIVWNSGHVGLGWYHAQSPAKAQWMDIACVETPIGTMRSRLERERYPAFTYDDALAWNTAVTRAFQEGRWAQSYQYFQPHTRLAEAAKAVNLAVAAGAQVCIQEHFRHTRNVLDRVRRTEPYLVDAQSAADVALHFSERAHNAYYHPENHATDLAFYRETGGVFKGLMSRHIPTEVVHDDSFCQTDVGRFRAVILPNSVCLPPATTQRLQAYVQEGGSLIATLETGLRGDDGRRAGPELLWPQSGLEFVADIETARRRAGLTPDNIVLEDDVPLNPDQLLLFDGVKDMQRWLGEDMTLASRADGWERCEGLQFHERVSCHLPARAVEVKADENWRTLLKMRFRRQKETGWEECPSILVRRFGRGRILYANFQLGTLISATGHAWWRHVLGRLVAQAAGTEPVQVRAPDCVRYFIWHQPAQRRYVLHLVNGLSGITLPETMREDHLPVAVNVKIALPGIQTVRAVIGGAGCRIERSATRHTVTHPAVRERLVLTCRY